MTELGDSATQAVAVGEPLIADLCVSAARRDASGRISGHAAGRRPKSGPRGVGEPWPLAGETEAPEATWLVVLSGLVTQLGVHPGTTGSVPRQHMRE